MKKINNNLRPYVARILQNVMPGIPQNFFRTRNLTTVYEAVLREYQAETWIKANPDFIALVQRVAQYYPKSSISLAWELYRWDATGLVEAGIAAREALELQRRLIEARIERMRQEIAARAVRDSAFQNAMESMS